jgi:hypothetical protein
VTKAEIRTKVLRQLRQQSAGVPFSEDEIDESIDAGYTEMSDASEWNEVWQTVNLLADRPYYDARTVLGQNLLAIGPAYSTETSRWLQPVVVGDLDGGDRRWESVVSPAAAPNQIFTRGLWWFGYYPRVSTDLGSVKQYFTAIPEALEDDDEPGFISEFHDGLVEYAVYDLWAQAGEADLALSAWTRYAAIESELTKHTQARGGRARVAGYAPHPH